MILRHLAVMAFAVGLVAPAPAFVGEPTASTETKAESDGEELICKKRKNFNTGSHMRPKPECRTAADWKEREIAAKRELQRLRDKHQSPGMGEGR